MILDFKIVFSNQEISDYLTKIGYKIIDFKSVEYERTYGACYSTIEKNIKLAIIDEDVSNLNTNAINKLEMSLVFKNVISDKLKNILLND